MNDLPDLVSDGRAAFVHAAPHERAASLDSLRSDERAIRESTAMIDRSDRAKILVSGPDRFGFLHAIVSNDVRDLRPGDGTYALLLNGKGQIRAEFPILTLADGFLLLVEPYERAFTLDALRRLRLRRPVTIDDVTNRYAEISLHGPRAAAVIEAWLGWSSGSLSGGSGGPTPVGHGGPTHQITIVDDMIIQTASTLGVPGYEILLPSPGRDTAWEGLVANGARPIDAEAFEIARIAAGTPRYGPELNEKTLPPEARLEDRALHYDKGCYPGQEIMARIRNRGQVHRLLTRLRIQGEAASGTVHAGEAAAGSITSAAYSPLLGQTVALGYLRRELRDRPLTLDDGRAVTVLEDA